MERQVGSIIALMAFVSCASVASDPRCTEYKQAERNASSTIAMAKNLQAEGKIDSMKLMKVDQDAALYSDRIKDLCHLFENGKLTQEQYREGLEEANQDYRGLRIGLLKAAGVTGEETRVSDVNEKGELTGASH